MSKGNYVVSYRGCAVVCTEKNYELACELLIHQLGPTKGDHPVISRYVNRRV